MNDYIQMPFYDMTDGCPPVPVHQTPRGLSIRPPYGTWLANPQRFIDAKLPPKWIENRDYDFTNGYRGPILIHQSKTFEHDALSYWSRFIPGIEQIFSMEPEGYPHGAFVGIADLVDVITKSSDKWFVGRYGLVLDNARPIYPVAYRGQLGLFSVSKYALDEIEEIAS
jgi:hypothetical protein